MTRIRQAAGLFHLTPLPPSVVIIAGHGKQVVVSPPDTTCYWVTAVRDYFYPPDCWDTVKIIVNIDDRPVLTPTADQVKTAGDNLAVSFSSAPAGTITWTNSNPAIGLPPAGWGNINITVLNPTAGVLTSEVIVWSFFGTCPSIPDTFTITVNPLTPAPPLLAAKVQLQGAVDTTTGIMRHDLATQDLIPSFEPYTGPGIPPCRKRRRRRRQHSDHAAQRE